MAGYDRYLVAKFAQLVAWRIGDFRFGGTTIAALAFLIVLGVGFVLAIQWARHRL